MHPLRKNLIRAMWICLPKLCNLPASCQQMRYSNYIMMIIK